MYSELNKVPLYCLLFFSSNYVVQHVLGLKVPQITENLLAQLEGNYIFLSRSKFGSNVVEKCLSELREEQSTRIIIELLRNVNVSMLLVDPFGNYVIQTALAVSKVRSLNLSVYIIICLLSTHAYWI